MAVQFYRLPAWETLTFAWQKTDGTKASIWAALGIVVLVAAGFGFVSGLFEKTSYVIALSADIIGQVTVSILQIGILYLAIRRAMDAPISYQLIFDVFHVNLIMKLMGLYALQFLLILLPALVLGGGFMMIFMAVSFGNNFFIVLGALLVILSIPVLVYLCLRMIFGIAFILDKDMGPVDAMKMSFKISKGNVLELLGIIILEMLFILVSIIPLGIGLIWSIPFSYVLYGVLYRRLLANA
jgi:uncharacterized membrane protein